MEYNKNTIEYITTQQTENVPNISCYIKINEEIDNLKDYETQISNIVKYNKWNE